eukprot:SAG25_NODE_980_length_4429_cov_1.828176_3_plen_171_part_00
MKVFLNSWLPCCPKGRRAKQAKEMALEADAPLSATLSATPHQSGRGAKRKTAQPPAPSKKRSYASKQLAAEEHGQSDEDGALSAADVQPTQQQQQQTQPQQQQLQQSPPASLLPTHMYTATQLSRGTQPLSNQTAGFIAAVHEGLNSRGKELLFECVRDWNCLWFPHFYD